MIYARFDAEGTLLISFSLTRTLARGNALLQCKSLNKDLQLTLSGLATE
jgi:hypothetical protein